MSGMDIGELVNNQEAKDLNFNDIYIFNDDSSYSWEKRLRIIGLEVVL